MGASIEPEPTLPLTVGEANALYRFFMECGYICPEKHMPVHEFFAKLRNFVAENINAHPTQGVEK